MINKMSISNKDTKEIGLIIAIDTAKSLSSLLTELLSKVLQSIALSVKKKETCLRSSYAAFKQHLEYNEIGSYNWIDGEQMVADIMNRENKHKFTGKEIQ